MNTTIIKTPLPKLPDGWKWVKLGDICQEQKKTIKPNESDSNSLPYLGLEHIQSNTGTILSSHKDVPSENVLSNTFYFDDNYVLYGKLRPYLNKVALPSFPGKCTSELIPLKPTAVNRDFLWWTLKRPETVSYAMMGKTGSRMPRANMKELMKMNIPLPPLDEQKRISAKLNVQMNIVMETRKAADEQLEAAKALSNAYLRQIFPSNGDDLPDGWKWVKLGDICEFKYGSSLPRHKRIIGQTPVYGSNGIVGWHNEPLIKSTTVIIGRKGSIGKVHLSDKACWPIDTAYFVSQSEVSSDVNLDWLYFVLIHSNFQKQDKSSAIPGLNRNDAYKMNLAIPPLEEQKRIVAKLKEQVKHTTELTEDIEQKLDLINALPSALLTKAFAGEP